MFGVTRRFSMALLLLLGSAALGGCPGASPGRTVTDSDEPTGEGPSQQDYMEQLRHLYQKAKEAGEDVPKDVMEWAKSDVKKIGTWDYHIVTFTTESEERMLEELKRLGGERWECFWVETLPEGKRFYLKRPIRSYLHLAGGGVAKFVPMPKGGE